MGLGGSLAAKCMNDFPTQFTHQDFELRKECGSKDLEASVKRNQMKKVINRFSDKSERSINRSNQLQKLAKRDKS